MKIEDIEVDMKVVLTQDIGTIQGVLKKGTAVIVDRLNCGGHAWVGVKLGPNQVVYSVMAADVTPFLEHKFKKGDIVRSSLSPSSKVSFEVLETRTSSFIARELNSVSSRPISCEYEKFELVEPVVEKEVCAKPDEYEVADMALMNEKGALLLIDKKESVLHDCAKQYGVGKYDIFVLRKYTSFEVKQVTTLEIVRKENDSPD